MSRENWWLDYVEGDIDEATQAEMKSLLRHSPTDQELVKSLSDTKTLLKEHAPSEVGISDQQLDFLHDKIMAGIEDVLVQPLPKYRLNPHHRRWVKTTSMGFLVLMVVLMAGQGVSNKSRNTQLDISQQMVEQVQTKPEDLSTLMTYQSEHDFFVDVASQSLDHFNKEQFESFLKISKTR